METEMKVSIVGSAGFVGSNLVEACMRKKWSVVGVDNFATGSRYMADPNRLLDLPGSYKFVELDMCDTYNLFRAFLGCEVVFLLAALPRVSFSIDHPLDANKANIEGVLSVLEASRQAGVKRVVFSCSSSVYGGVSQFPTPETATPSPKSPYALHKQTGAEYCRLYSELHGLETCSLLYFNVFGQYQRTGGAYSTVIPAFFEAGIQGKSCRIDGDGNQSRDFTSIENVVQANLLAAEHSDKLMGDRFNIANGDTYSVNQVYEEVKRLLCIDLQKHHVKERLGDPRKSQADITKAKEVLGYNPQINFYEGMKKVSGWWLAGCPIKWEY
jgi:UDP-N-acetylglucosamine 4-epimerase